MPCLAGGGAHQPESPSSRSCKQGSLADALRPQPEETPCMDPEGGMFSRCTPPSAKRGSYLPGLSIMWFPGGKVMFSGGQVHCKEKLSFW